MKQTLAGECLFHGFHADATGDGQINYEEFIVSVDGYCGLHFER